MIHYPDKDIPLNCEDFERRKLVLTKDNEFGEFLDSIRVDIPGRVTQIGLVELFLRRLVEKGFEGAEEIHLRTTVRHNNQLRQKDFHLLNEL